MRVSYLLVSIFCLSYQPTECSVTDDYIDPLDMFNYDRTTKTMRKTTATTSGESTQSDDRCRVFLPRFVNMLLKNTGISNLNYQSNNENDNRVKSYVSVALSVEDLHLLETMTTTNEIDYLEIDRILNSMFTVEKKLFSGFQRTNYFMETYQIKEVLYWISIGSIIVFLLYIIFRNIRQVFSVTFVVFIIFTLAFASTWYTMYMKANINRSVHLEYMPAHCNSKIGGWFPWFTTNNLDECKKYREAIYLNPKYSIALTEVLAEMLSKTLMKPIESLGQSIYVFNKSALKDFPIWAQMIMVPIIIIIIIKTLLLSCALLIGRNLSMKSMFGYGSTSIGPGPTNNERCAANDKINNSIHSMVSEQHIPTQMPEMPKFNFNINLFTPNSSFSHQNFSKDTSFKVNKENIIDDEANNSLISMLKNKEIDSVDNKNIYLVEKRRRHRTLSI